MKIFKTIFTITAVLVLMQSCVVSEKPNMEFFSNADYDYQGARFVSFNVPLFLAKPYIKKALKEDGESEAVYDLVKKVSKIKIMTVENGNTALMRDHASYLTNHNYQDWATIKHDGDNVNIRIKQIGETIKNMLITVKSDKEMVFVDVRGSFTTDDISKMISYASDK